MESGVWKPRDEGQSWKYEVDGEWMEEETLDNKIDPCGACRTRVMCKSVLCAACGKWVHARYTNKKVAVDLNKKLVCKKCRSVVKNFKGPNEILCDGVETVSKFSYLRDRLNANGGCETAVTARSRIGWMKFRECSEILKGRFSLKMKGKVYKSYVRSAMLYGREAWCFSEKDMAILRTKRAMIRAMWGVKLLESKKQRGVDGHVGHKGVFK